MFDQCFPHEQSTKPHALGRMWWNGHVPVYIWSDNIWNVYIRCSGPCANHHLHRSWAESHLAVSTEHAHYSCYRYSWAGSARPLCSHNTLWFLTLALQHNCVAYTFNLRFRSGHANSWMMLLQAMEFGCEHEHYKKKHSRWHMATIVQTKLFGRCLSCPPFWARVNYSNKTF